MVFAPANRQNYGGKRTKKIEWIVMHYTANDGDTGASNARYFQTVITKSSAHYFVDDTSVTLSVPEDYIAWHCGTAGNAYQQYHPFCTNSNSIGIELCDTRRDGTVLVTSETLRNAAKLAARLCAKYAIPTEHIIRHYDVTHKLCPAYWIGNDGLLKFRHMVKEVIPMTKQELLSLQGTGDRPSDWAAEATSWAKAQGIFTGDEAGNYGWQQPITREAVAEILYRFAQREQN